MERKEKACKVCALLLRRRQDALELCLELLRGALEKLELLLVLTLLRLPAFGLAALNLIWRVMVVTCASLGQRRVYHQQQQARHLQSAKGGKHKTYHTWP